MKNTKHTRNLFVPYVIYDNTKNAFCQIFLKKYFWLVIGDICIIVVIVI